MSEPTPERLTGWHAGTGWAAWQDANGRQWHIDCDSLAQVWTAAPDPTLVEAIDALRDVVAERDALRSVIARLLDGYDPDCEQMAWCRVIGFTPPQEKEDGPMTDAERAVIEAIRSEAS